MDAKYRWTVMLYNKLVLIGPYENLEPAIEWVNSLGYRVTQSGPKIVDALRIDTSQFEIHAEKEAGQTNEHT